MNSHPPQSIPVADFKLRFDASTIAGKIAVMQEAERVGYVYMNTWFQASWHKYEVDFSVWDWHNYMHNFPAHEPKRVLVPWTKDTVPREAWFRERTKRFNELRIIAITENFIGFSSPGTLKDNLSLGYTLITREFEHSLDGGKTWLPCGTWKEEV